MQHRYRETALLSHNAVSAMVIAVTNIIRLHQGKFNALKVSIKRNDLRARALRFAKPCSNEKMEFQTKHSKSLFRFSTLVKQDL